MSILEFQKEKLKKNYQSTRLRPDLNVKIF